MICPHCGQDIRITPKEAADALRQFRDPEKARENARINGAAPVKAGSKPRGWPKGRKRKPATK